jgi:hypothetical protein
MGLSDGVPVVFADAEQGGVAGGARRAVDAHDALFWDAEVAAERRVGLLLTAEVVFRQDG